MPTKSTSHEHAAHAVGHMNHLEHVLPEPHRLGFRIEGRVGKRLSLIRGQRSDAAGNSFCDAFFHERSRASGLNSFNTDAMCFALGTGGKSRKVSYPAHNMLDNVVYICSLLRLHS